ncbi:MAG: hypothetical protein H0T89_03335 [Deltaproteobacteria bacterium]|nr:hypothetical protein [Deltaproteobacteria bacterium]MDQ3299040.1 hypothetical protein [Myxococcota bacterium]
MTRLSAAEVFTPTSYPTYTYVPRDELHHERLLRQWTQSSTQIASVSGPSKAGKTVLVQRVVGEGNLITVSGASVREADQLWERVLDWYGEPHTTTASHGDTTTDSKTNERVGTLGLAGMGASSRATAASTSAAAETTQATVHRRGLPQVVGELAGTALTLLLDDFHYIPAAIQSDVAQQLKDAASRGVRICVASVPHRADNIVRALPELRGRVLAIDIDYWTRRDLLEIPRLGCERLGIHVDTPSLTMFATEAAGSPQLMQSICLWMCNHLGVREAALPPRAVTLDEAARKEILFLTSCTVDFRSLVRALISGPKARPGERKKYLHRDGREGDIYLTIMRAVAMDPPRLTLEYGELGRRLEVLCTQNDSPDGASVVRTCVALGQIARSAELGFGGTTGASLEWEERDQVFVLPDPYLLFYLRWSGMLERAAEGDGA